MANLKELRTRIKSVISTRQITSAMKMVSAARLRRAQDSIIRIRPYATKLHEILTHLAASLDVAEDNIYAEQREIKRVLLVMISSNRGLCGGFNSNVSKKALQIANEKYKQQFDSGLLDFFAVGKKAEEILKRKHPVKGRNYEIFDQLEFSHAAVLAEDFMKKFTSEEYDVVEIIYNGFKNAAVQVITAEQYLPIEIDNDEYKNVSYDYIFEPSKEYIVKDLIPKSLKIQFYKALLDSYAAEHGARMTAMHKATDNATELLGDLRLAYNKARQDAITKEILEIVSGAEALKG